MENKRSLLTQLFYKLCENEGECSESFWITAHPWKFNGRRFFSSRHFIYKCYHIWRKWRNNLWFEKLMKIRKIMSPWECSLWTRVWNSLHFQYTAAAFTVQGAVNKRKCCVFTGILQASDEDEAQGPVETIDDKIPWGGGPGLWRCGQVSSDSSVLPCTQPCQPPLCFESSASPASFVLFSFISISVTD